MSKERFEVTIKRNGRIVKKHKFQDYWQASDCCDKMEYRYQAERDITVEFKDNDPFSNK